MVELDIWIEKVQRAEYLAEDELKALCEYVRSIRIPRHLHSSSRNDLYLTHSLNSLPFLQVKEVLVEESNVQPVNSPVTVSFSS